MVRTRMAPSPTGEYHVGHIRTVLYNYALAKSAGGKFILRIEDTDQARIVQGAVQKILDVINDYGLNWDEGPQKDGDYGPYIQSQRLSIYKNYALELIESGHAYYCFCTKDRLAQLREDQQKQGLPVTKYDKKCLHLKKQEIENNLALGTDYVIRLNVVENQIIKFNDMVYGEIVFNSSDIDDQVLLKSDGFPSYHLAVVVDDHLMKITHIMRGNDWIPSTPKHVLLYKAFNWEMPKIIHLPNLKELGGDKKLSKRYGSVFAIEFLKEGYLPQAVLNFLMFLGWNPGTEKEIFSLEEFIEEFDVNRIQKTDLVSFDRQKLLWFNGHYIRNLSPQDLFEKIILWSNKYNIQINGISTFEKDYMIKVLTLVQERMKVLSDFNLYTDYFFYEPKIDQSLLNKFIHNEKKISILLNQFLNLFTSIDISNWTRFNLETQCLKMVKENNFSNKEAFMALRIVLTGKESTPQIFDILSVLKKQVVIKRISNQISITK